VDLSMTCFTKKNDTHSSRALKLYATVACLLTIGLSGEYSSVHAFLGKNVHHWSTPTLSSLRSSSSPFQEPADDPSVQWDLFNTHHAKGSWKGVWTTYDYIGDVMDETVASVDLNLKQNEDGQDIVEHTHTIVVGAKRSDCATCFDSMERRTLPVQKYTADNILQKSRLAGVSMVNGPSILRSGAMATELILRHGDGRIRATFHHAPVWERGVEPGSCPPQGLKLFRAMLSREAIRETAPTAETEGKDVPKDGNPVFFRPVPPFNWHKKWRGTSWTWGPQSGNRGWAVEELDETDSWHGITPVECWNLRLPGGIHLQAPRIINDASVGICRLAWLPNDETLLRVEAGVSALQPMMVEDDMMIGFEPPKLTSLRCDMLEKAGELEDAPRPSREWNSNDDEVETLESLQNKLASIEALEERNAAQLDSFVDEKDQWESLESHERDLLSSKEEVLKRLTELSNNTSNLNEPKSTKESTSTLKKPTKSSQASAPPATPRDFLSL